MDYFINQNKLCCLALWLAVCSMLPAPACMSDDILVRDCEHEYANACY